MRKSRPEGFSKGFPFHDDFSETRNPECHRFRHRLEPASNHGHECLARSDATS